MRSIKYFLPIILLAAVSNLFFARSEGAKAQSENAATKPTPVLVWWAEAQPMPDELMYRVLFEQIAALSSKDGESTTPKTAFKTTFYEDRLKLAPEQFAALDFAVDKYKESVAPLDRRAAEIVSEYRSQLPNGELKKAPPPKSAGIFATGRFWGVKAFEDLPAPPVELKELQKRRDLVVLSLKDVIRKSIGDAEFKKFDEAVRKNAAEMISPGVRHKPMMLPDQNEK